MQFFLRKIWRNVIDISDKSDVIFAWLNVKKTWIYFTIIYRFRCVFNAISALNTRRFYAENLIKTVNNYSDSMRKFLLFLLKIFPSFVLCATLKRVENERLNRMFNPKKCTGTGAFGGLKRGHRDAPWYAEDSKMLSVGIAR